MSTSGRGCRRPGWCRGGSNRYYSRNKGSAKSEKLNMDEEIKPRYGIDPYLEWVRKEGLPVVEDYGIYLFDVETRPWPRFGVKAAACHLKGRGDFANMFLFELPPGGSTVPQRHLY